MKFLVALLLWLPMWFASLDFAGVGSVSERLDVLAAQAQQMLEDFAEVLFTAEREAGDADSWSDESCPPDQEPSASEPAPSEPAAIDPLGVDVGNSLLSRAEGLA